MKIKLIELELHNNPHSIDAHKNTGRHKVYVNPQYVTQVTGRRDSSPDGWVPAPNTASVHVVANTSYIATNVTQHDVVGSPAVIAKLLQS